MEVTAALAVLLHPLQDLSWSTFSIHWSTVAGIVGLGALYAWRSGKAPQGERAPSALQRIAFVAGLLILFLSLNGPLHDLSDVYLFSAHMVQHLLLTMLVIPLLLAATPGWMFEPALRVPAISRIARRITTPAAGFVIFNVTLAAWHLPPMYNLAMASHEVHIAQHICFLVAATLMWWPLMSKVPSLPRPSYGQQMLYTFLLTLPMALISVCIVYADSVLYPAYEVAPRVFPISPLEDQRLGGLIMWIPGGIVMIGVLSSIFFRWVAAEGRETQDTHPGPVPVHAVPHR